MGLKGIYTEVISPTFKLLRGKCPHRCIHQNMYILRGIHVVLMCILTMVAFPWTMLPFFHTFQFRSLFHFVWDVALQYLARYAAQWRVAGRQGVGTASHQLGFHKPGKCHMLQSAWRSAYPCRHCGIWKWGWNCYPDSDEGGCVWWQSPSLCRGFCEFVCFPGIKGGIGQTKNTQKKLCTHAFTSCIGPVWAQGG